MKYLMDGGNLEEIKYCNEYFPLAGVTTNPTLISKEKTDFLQRIRDIRDIIGPDKMIHVQTVQKTAEGIIEEAEFLKKEMGANFFLKIPIGEEGLRATMMLKKMGIDVTMTAIFTPPQALIAAMAGASYVAPYVNRLDNIVGEGTRVVAEIVEQFKTYNIDCKVLAASFKSVEQVHKCALAGCDAITVSADIFKAIISHSMTDATVKAFDEDWHGQYGNRTFID